MLLRFFACLALALCACAETRVGETARALRGLEFDEDRCYRVRELNFQREDAKFFLTDGYLIFSKPVAGLPVAAAFSAEVESGEAELLLLPPTRSERMSLASFTRAPNLAERFHRAIFLFTDGTAEEWDQKIAAAAVPFKKSAEMGLVLKQRFEPAARNLAASFEVRALQDLISAKRRDKGFFYAALGGAALGNFDLFADQRGRHLLTLGQVVNRDQGSVFDVWTQFEGRSRREQAGPRRAVTEWDPKLDDFRIDVTVHPDLRIEATTRVKATVADAAEGALPFEISSQMRITGARIDGEPAEVFLRDSLRSTLMTGGQNELMLIVPARPLVAGQTYDVEFKHEGSVIREAGNGVFFVGSRANWYPQRGLQMARYDVTFRYPKALTLVSAGEAAAERTEGDWRISRWTTPVPVRMLGFNLGRFERSTQTRGAYRLDVYANRLMEGPPSPPAMISAAPPTGLPTRGPRRGDMPVFPPPQPPAPSPLARLQRLAEELSETFESMAAWLGPPPLKTVNVTPIPGRFGQGFPGLLYLSTLNYVDPVLQASAAKGDGALYFEILQAHEIAHQWWGNLVTPGALEDDWLMEGLANYTALLYVEKRRGAKVLDRVLETYKGRLLRTGEDGQTVESAGPIVWGTRLSSSQLPQAWQAITYEKGSWIFHMLRRRLGDAAFKQLLSELTRRYAMAPLTNVDVQRVAAELLPSGGSARQNSNTMAAFFDTWVYGTGVPTLKLQHKVSATRAGVTLSGTLTQTGADEDFTAEVPVEIQLGRGRLLTHWVKSAAGAVDFSVRLPAGVTAAQVKAALDPGGWLLRR